MKFSVIITSLNGADALPGCLRALAATRTDDGSRRIEYETIVVDNGSTDGTSDVATRHYPDARVVRSDINLGFAGGNNLGMRVATGDAFVLLNDDTEVDPDWLLAFDAVASERDDWAALGARLLYPDGTLQSAGATIGPNALTAHIGCGEPDEPDRYADVTEQPYVCGAAIVFKREIAEQLGGLDEGFFPIYFEEVDFCVRARRLGHQCYYVPDARVTHLESRATVARSHGYNVRYHKNRLRFVLKNFSAGELIRFKLAEAKWLILDHPFDVYLPLGQACLLAAIGLPFTLAARWRSPKPLRSLRTVVEAQSALE